MTPQGEPVALIVVHDGVIIQTKKLGPVPPDGQYAIYAHPPASAPQDGEDERALEAWLTETVELYNHEHPETVHMVVQLIVDRLRARAALAKGDDGGTPKTTTLETDWEARLGVQRHGDTR